MGQGTFRLPTEAEWEYACRAGTTERFYWGDSDAEDVMKQYCWYEKNGGISQPVGLKSPNLWGLFDMSGNVWEWCQDWLGDYPTTPIVDPKGQSYGLDQYRVLRGGCHYIIARYCRSAVRIDYNHNDRNSGSGFRLSRTP